MKKVITLVLLFVLLLSGCSHKSASYDDQPYQVFDGYRNLFSLEHSIDKMMKNMTVEEKIAQMLIVSVSGTSLSSDFRKQMTSHPYGGVIFFAGNFSTFQKTRDFISDLKQLSDIPLLVSVDQEGGIVQRLNSLDDVKVSNVPSMYTVGRTGDPQNAYAIGRLIAEEVRTLGFNLVFAPCSDVFSNPNNKVISTRSFSSDPQTVAKMVTALSDGLQDNGVMSCYKHFPGHGDTKTDSHYNLPVINKTLEQMQQCELVPFEAAVKNKASMIMIGHIAFPALTGDNTPASVSDKLINGLLKQQMGYDGLVITDGLGMRALTSNYTTEQIYTMAINAGCDILLMPTDSQVIDIIKKNVSIERIDQSVKKILMYKYTYLTDYQLLDKSYLNSPEHQEIISRIKGR